MRVIRDDDEIWFDSVYPNIATELETWDFDFWRSNKWKKSNVERCSAELVTHLKEKNTAEYNRSADMFPDLIERVVAARARSIADSLRASGLL